MYPSRERFRGSSPPPDIELAEPKVTVEYLEGQVSGLSLQGKDFHQFALLPVELQLKIWKHTLPSTTMIRTSTWEGSTTLWPVLEFPKPPEPGKVYGRIPTIPPFPDPEDHPAALHVCRLSRTIALENLFPLNDAISKQKKGRWHDYISRNDIVDLEIGRRVIRSLGGPRKPFQTLNEALRKVEDENPGQGIQFPECVIYDDLPVFPNPFFEFSSRKYCVLVALPEISEGYRQGSEFTSVPSDYPIRKGYVAVRLSDIEEHILGSKISLGAVPPSLWYQKPRDPWSRYSQETGKGKFRPFNLYPSHILYIYSHVLHELAFGYHSDCVTARRYTPTNTPSKYLSVFQALINGNDCPACGEAVLPRIKELYGDAIDFEKIEIFVLSSRSWVESREGHWETVDVEIPDIPGCENM
ncbi:hypothetical protein JX265_002108 [Neoarthrinium moseri]|uniref:2EXR domain-containing protein n=1 Tax=Neoarthrinium moseri TaxID=1658444 RepID=A0A9P9WTN4_9PEZI|nr:uncharacterized protein JN550_001769 [Neoarthrinium moseri]KAI1876273.1 hypothetical protein JN550_001769 [Neoarthrinium moseri]KAI1879154.1 hypothetical protein JX265_002108 [Neoarthrinium moseri]